MTAGVAGVPCLIVFPRDDAIIAAAATTHNARRNLYPYTGESHGGVAVQHCTRGLMDFIGKEAFPSLYQAHLEVLFIERSCFHSFIHSI